MNTPMGIAEFRHLEKLPEELKGQLPTLEEIEAWAEKIEEAIRSCTHSRKCIPRLIFSATPRCSCSLDFLLFSTLHLSVSAVILLCCFDHLNLKILSR
jgi:hypothetical protein